MPEEADRRLVHEFLRREQVKASKGLLVNAIRGEFFPEQDALFADPARNKGALCTRRAGKTHTWTRYCTIVAVIIPRAVIRIWGITRLRAKQLLWEEFKLLFGRHRLKVIANETELTFKFENGSEIRLLGADKDKEVEKKRGDKTAMEVVLEAQLYGPYLKKLVEEVAEPCLFDLRGTFCLEGTPGLLCAGYWWEVSGREDFARRWLSPGGAEGLGAGWSMHRWSVLQNPHIPHAREELAAIKKKRRWTDETPTYVREWLGRWVNDLQSLYYRFDPLRNTFTHAEVKPWGPGWEHTLGWDLGFRDDMAIVVWGYHTKHDTLFEAFSWKEPGALSPRVVEVIRQLETSGIDGTPFNITARVADTGGGGRMYVEEVAARHGMAFEAAKKTEKYEHVRLMNDDLLGGFVKMLDGSAYSQEIAALPRDPDWPPPEKPEAPPREDPRFPNHCSDAGLYGWRRAWHFLHREEVAKPMQGSNKWAMAEAKAMEDRVLAAVRREKTGAWRFGDEGQEVDAEWWEHGDLDQS